MTIEEIHKKVEECKKMLLEIQKESSSLKSDKEDIREQFTTISETYDFANCWIETFRFKKENTKIHLVDFYDKQTDDKKITADNIDWLDKDVIYKNFRNNGINTNIIPYILYAISDTNNKIKNNE